jgi:hypothetical protein
VHTIGDETSTYVDVICSLHPQVEEARSSTAEMRSILPVHSITIMPSFFTATDLTNYQE